MKNLLLISYSFPPARNVGALRPRGIAKYLPYYGWKVFVLTPLLGIPRDSQYNMVETYPPFRERMGYLRKKLYFDFSQIISHPPLYKIFLSNFSEIVPFPDTKKGWVVHGVYAGKYVIEKESISAIISTCSPISCHTIAHKLKKIFPQLVWVADFRDLWAHNPFHKHTRPTQFLKETVEKKLLENADFITTVSEPLADHLRRFHNKETFSIPNGFDPDEYNFDAQVDQKFSITYTGSIYPEERDPELLFIALRKLISGDSRIEEDIEVNFFCRYNAALDELIRKYNLDKVVHQNGIVARENVIKIQKSSHILLLLLPEDKGVYTG
ncbi:MAG TPA: hypothetical protein PLW07_03205, partial [bacterium]|nr:hypothetical protein [bacterium]